ncbi:MAG: glycoside hydrolase family 1 protein [Ktedonobacteraceae bacterium]|nr:glycoside hydrolase family 1 protein [Ktedonobacteraceae bacterium]
MTQQRALHFPKSFLWGTASAAHQCEGGNTNNQWYRWEQQGRILSGEQCGDACDWWREAEKDFTFAEQMENGALRLSIEWSRVEPDEGRWDKDALERYRVLLADLHQRHITPVVTLHHFTEPLWFVDRGGFAHEQNVQYFVRYVTYVTQHLRDLCDFWITINEPNVYATEGYLRGVFPPGEKNLQLTFQVLRNLIQGHVAAFYAIRSIQPESRIGYCLHYRLFEPSNPLSPLDQGIARTQEGLFNWALLQAAETGRFPFPTNMFLPPISGAAGARDYHGINYYTRETVRFDPTLPHELFGRRFIRPGAICNDAGLDGSFGEIYPEGLYRVLQTVYRRTHGNKPLYITENGFCDAADSRRPAAILAHLAMLHRAIREGIPVRGYFYWSLVDNFEWNHGWYVRFGLVEIDPLTQRRVPRPSASMFGEICRANALTESTVERYAPELLDTIFGSSETHRQPSFFI